MNINFITISYDALKVKLIEFHAALEQKSMWHTPFGIFLALLLAIIASDFTDALGINKDTWRGIVYVCLVISAIWCIYEFKKIHKIIGINDFIEKLKESSYGAKDSRILFLFKNTDSQGAWHLLVNDCPVFCCYMLPHTRRSDGPLNDEDMKTIISQKLKLDKNNVTIASLDNLDIRSYKINEYTEKNDIYSFGFCLVNVRGDAHNNLLMQQFQVNGANYRWKTIDELINDERSMKKNSDVLVHIQNNFSSFFSEQTSKSFAAVLGDNHV